MLFSRSGSGPPTVVFLTNFYLFLRPPCTDFLLCEVFLIIPSRVDPLAPALCFELTSLFSSYNNNLCVCLLCYILNSLILFSFYPPSALPSVWLIIGAQLPWNNWADESFYKALCLKAIVFVKLLTRDMRNQTPCNRDTMC